MDTDNMDQKSMKRIEIEGRGVAVRGDDIDTDRIIPARYLKCVTFEELGAFAFNDERFDTEGNTKDHPFNDNRYDGAAVLVVNKNFGCGSSREHAPQSLMRMGIRVIVGESFAEIFAGNCTALGIPTVRASAVDIARLMDAVESNPDTVRINLESDVVESTSGDVSINGTMPQAYRSSLIEGTWDTTAALLANREEIRKIGESLPYIAGF
jgi:3-isopropylmalate/(R)-2-methylmalate dehydratase small subunit